MTAHSISEGLAEDAGAVAAGKSNSLIGSAGVIRIGLCMYIPFPKFLFKVFEFARGLLTEIKKRLNKKSWHGIFMMRVNERDSDISCPSRCGRLGLTLARIRLERPTLHEEICSCFFLLRLADRLPDQQR
jgi:hypothetical protein